MHDCSRRWHTRIVIWCAFGLLAFAASSTLARAADQVVNNCSNDDELRADLAAMQGGSGGTLTFNCGTATIVLDPGSPLPAIATNTIINGAGTITLSGGNSTRLFTVNVGATLTLNNLTVTKGYRDGDGGAIHSVGTLNINGSGGAIVSYGVLNITNSEFGSNKAANGGALYPRFGLAATTITGSNFHHNETTSVTDGWGGALLLWDGAPVIINNSTFSDNKARDGGALYVFANSNLILNNSTVRANSASDIVGGGGGIYNNGTATITGSTLNGNSTTFFNYGGAILNSHAGTLTLTNSTLSGNTSDEYGGGIFNVGKGTLTNVTLSGNSSRVSGGGIWHNGGPGDTLTLKNTIIVHGSKGENCYKDSNSQTTISSAGFNLSSDGFCIPYFNQAGDWNTANGFLGPLTNNGGATLTHMIFAPSKAIDNGACIGGITTDQRGSPRPQGLACDIGAVERRPLEPSLFLPLIAR